VSDRTVHAVVTGTAGAVILLVLRVALGVAFDRYLGRVARRRPPDHVARLRTRLVLLRKVIVAFAFVIVVWSVLEVFPATEELARTLLASGAVVALFVGVAFSVPLGNIGAGILLSLTQPVRIGDRISIGDVTGTAEEIGLIHTVVRTDDERIAFVPNTQMVTSAVVNRSIQDPRRPVTVRLPIAITASVDDARRVLLETVRRVEGAALEDVSVLVGDVAERAAWLNLSAQAPPGAAVEQAAAELRELGLAALAEEGLLPQ
jgi:small-conductance mechanosensitive channel